MTLLAHRLTLALPFPVCRTAWYRKVEPTFSDAVALVRRYLYTYLKTVDSRPETQLLTLPSRWLHGLIDTVCYST